MDLTTLMNLFFKKLFFPKKVLEGNAVVGESVTLYKNPILATYQYLMEAQFGGSALNQKTILNHPGIDI